MYFDLFVNYLMWKLLRIYIINILAVILYTNDSNNSDI